MTTDLLAELNDQQRAAVTAPDGPALVIAAAGTGKTRTLTHRVAWLVREHDIRPWQILLLTFTNRAAREMLERAGQLLRGGIESIWGGTFHSVANRMLRHHAERLGYDRNFSILDEDDSAHILKQCISELGLSGKDRKFPKPDVLHGLFGLAASREADLRETLENRFTSSDADIDGMMKVHALYEKKKREQNGMDFDDLLVNGLRLLQDNRDIAEHYGHTFRHILVDEYQDTSRIQSEFVESLLQFQDIDSPENIMVVGDDFQSIYSWRGADIDNFLEFTKRHPKAKKYDLGHKVVYKLEDNYRSIPGVLRVANEVISHTPELFQKTLRSTRPEGSKPALVHLSDGRHQARFIVTTINKLLEDHKARRDEIAVLYRSHFHAMELQLELNRNRIPYTVVSGVRFFEQAHIKDICAPLRLAANPADETAFARWMELLPKVGPKGAQNIWTKLGHHLDLHDPAARATLSATLPAAARSTWKEIESALFPDGDTFLLDRPELFVKAFVKVFYADFIDATFDNPHSRQDDIMELCAFASQYQSTQAFLNEMSLLTNTDVPGGRSEIDEASQQDTIRLTTIHQAKGLEWKAVFVLWMVHGMFPSARSLDEPGMMSEERRLFYVAVTRAKDYLWLCVPQMRRVGGPGGGDMQYCAPSAFIDEVASELRVERPLNEVPYYYASNNRY